MAYIVGFISKDKRKELERRGWEVEDASDYDLIGDDEKYLLHSPPKGSQAVVIWVDTDVFGVMDGPDWDKGPPLDPNVSEDEKVVYAISRMELCEGDKDPFRPADNWTRCPSCKEMFGWNNENGLEGQTCECCSYVFTGNEDPNGCSGPEDREER